MKSFGGNWATDCGSVDGSKNVCMDYFLPSVKAKKCLIYSFGISDDWTFEDAMADFGCQVSFNTNRYPFNTIAVLFLGPRIRSHD